MADFSIDDYRPDDEQQVLQVLRVALGESDALPRTPEFWRWKHFENPFGASSILVARIRDQVVGVRAYLQWRFVTPTGELKAVRPVDTATHPSHHRKGIFRSLTLEANRRAEMAGVDLIFNTPNEKSRPGYLSMGWLVVGKPRLYARLVRPALLRRAHGEAVPDPGFVIPAGGPVHLGEIVVDRAPLGIRTKRSADYMRWRFERHPTVMYRAIQADSSIVIARARRRAGRVEVVVSELLGVSQSSLRHLRRGMMADYMVGSARPSSPEARLFTRSGFLPAFGLGLTLTALPLTPAASGALSLSAWDLSAGDLELM